MRNWYLVVGLLVLIALGCGALLHLLHAGIDRACDTDQIRPYTRLCWEYLL